MNKTIIGLLSAGMLVVLGLPMLVYAQTVAPELTVQTSPMDMAVADLQKQWAIIKYQTPNEEKQEEAITALSKKAEGVVKQFPGKAEPLIWQGIILATEAGIEGGLFALGDAKSARNALEQAEKIDPSALNGSVYTSLGSLYYKVPGFPIGFGDNAKAKEYLEKALAMNPDGIDPNFFYGDFLYEQGEYAKSEQALNHALQAAPRAGRELADKGRTEEIRDVLTKIKQKKG